jgi:ABC-2 type transport system permease protein
MFFCLSRLRWSEPGPAYAAGAIPGDARVLGFLNKFLALPSPRESILFGKIAFITFRGLLQATVILALAFMLGVRMPGIPGMALVYLTLAVFGVLGAAVATTIALKVDDHDGYAAVNSVISMPLFFASSALMPYSDMPPWLRVLASLNPVSFAIDTVRSIFSGTIAVAGIVELAALALVVAGISTYMFRKATV